MRCQLWACVQATRQETSAPNPPASAANQPTCPPTATPKSSHLGLISRALLRSPDGRREGGLLLVHHRRGLRARDGGGRGDGWGLGAARDGGGRGSRRGDGGGGRGGGAAGGRGTRLHRKIGEHHGVDALFDYPLQHFPEIKGDRGRLGVVKQDAAGTSHELWRHHQLVRGFERERGRFCQGWCAWGRWQRVETAEPSNANASPGKRQQSSCLLRYAPANPAIIAGSRHGRADSRCNGRQPWASGARRR